MTRGSAAAGLVATVVATGVVTAGTWGRGVVLYRDDVQVPHPVWGASALGLGSGPPRSVPYAGVLALLSHVLGAPGAQRLVLLAPLLLAGSGVTVLLRRRGGPACVVAAVAAVWNPYVAERLGLGQAPTLLAYGALPWLVVAVRWSRDRGALTTAAACTVASLPAAMTPVGSVMALVVLACALLAGRRRPREVFAGLLGPALLWAPWVAAAAVSGAVTAQAAGAQAFAARDDTGAGLLLSVATLGGVWSPAAAPGSRQGAAPVVLGLLLLVVAAVGWWSARGTTRWSLVLAWVVPVAAVGLAATSVGVDVLASAQEVPGLALLRDTHRLLAPAALAVAVGTGLGVQRVVDALARRGSRLLAVGPVAVLAAVVVLAVPDLPGTTADRYRPVLLPADWSRAVATVQASGRGVLSLPWQPLRSTAWNGGRPFLDPLDLAVGGPVLSSRRLQVQRGGALLVTDADDEPAAGSWARGMVDPVELATRGVGWVLEMRRTPGAAVVPTSGLTLVQDGQEVRLWQVDGAVRPAPGRPGRGFLLGAWLVAGAALLLALARLVLKGAARRADEGLRGRATSR